MKCYFDTSAIAKRYLAEPGSGAINEICAMADALGISALAIPELASGVHRRVREKKLSVQEYRHIMRRFQQEAADMTVLHVTEHILLTAVRVIEQSPVRTLDALHVATAAVWGANLFVTGDRRQLAAASAAGLATRYAGGR